MDYSVVSKVTVKKENYDILAADTRFYAYMGKERLYYTFDRFIYEEDREYFYAKVKAVSGEVFTLRMELPDGSFDTVCMRVREGASAEQFVVEVARLGSLFESEHELSRHLLAKTGVLKMYGDIIFAYIPRRDQILIDNTGRVGSVLEEYTFESCYQMIKSANPPERQQDIDEVFSAIRGDMRDFDIVIDGNVFGSSRDIKSSRIRGKAIYEDGVLDCVTGYIHQMTEDTEPVVKRYERDNLTGVLTKGEITRYAMKLIGEEHMENVSIAIVDVDSFKSVNDTYGHMVGDEVLKRVATILETEVGDKGVVGRFGGDEFYIVFHNAYDMEECRERLRSIKNIVNSTFPDGDESKPKVTLSIGCAAYPKDADNYDDLLYLADFALYRAKEKGKNRYIIYNAELHGSIEELRKTKKIGSRINSAGNMSMGDIVCTIMDKAYTESDYSLEKMIDDCVENIDADRISLYSDDDYRLLEFYENDEYIVNDVSIINNRNQEAYKKLLSKGIISFMHFVVRDRAGKSRIVAFEAINRKINWNTSNISYYRLLARLIGQHIV